jgi:GNAT superfamily N-acetyltransferase
MVRRFCFSLASPPDESPPSFRSAIRPAQPPFRVRWQWPESCRVPHAGNGIDGGGGSADGAFVDDRIVDELELRDGERIVVRPIRPDDGGQLAELHARLSDDSIYRRYFGFKPSLSQAEIRRFTGIAEECRFALVGVRSTGQLAGVARYEGQAGQVDAEIALIVDDALHHLGLGSLMLQRLVDVARISGMASLTAVVLSSNLPMLHLLQALHLPLTSTRGTGDVVVRLDLAAVELPADRSRIAAAHVADAAAIRAGLVSLPIMAGRADAPRR